MLCYDWLIILFYINYEYANLLTYANIFSWNNLSFSSCIKSQGLSKLSPFNQQPRKGERKQKACSSSRCSWDQESSIAWEAVERLPRLTKQRVDGVGQHLPSFPDALLHGEFEKVMAARPPAGPRRNTSSFRPFHAFSKIVCFYLIFLFTNILYSIYLFFLVVFSSYLQLSTVWISSRLQTNKFEYYF